MNPVCAEEQTRTESPHFRPVFGDLTNNDPFQALELSPGQLARKRKSLGRRVSFAAKAKVRFIDNNADSEGEVVLQGAPPSAKGKSEHGDNENEENGDIFGVLRRNEDFHQAMPPAAKNPDQVDNPFTVKIATAPVVLAGSPRSDASLSVVSNESIEVEVRDPDPNSSFSSYESNEEVDDGQTAFGTFDDMELTNCVGGIIGSIGNIPNVGNIASIAIDENCESMMDLTTCIGGILGEIPHYAGLSDVASSQHVASPSSIDTMELTRCVGGILSEIVTNQPSKLNGPPKSPLNATFGQNYDSDGDSASPSTLDEGISKMTSKDHAEVDMEMTVILKDTIKESKLKQVQVPPSPSPFLVKSPAGRFSTVHSPGESDMSFIGDTDAPMMLGMGASPAPIRERAGDKEDFSHDQTSDLFLKYIDTERIEAAADPDLKEETSTTMPSISMAPPTLVHANPSFTPATTRTVMPPLSAASKALSHVLSSDHQQQQQQSVQESPTITNILPRASLKDFLNETGIRFLDNLSSLARRETTGCARESDFASAAKQLYVDAALSLENDMLDAGCEQLTRMIQRLREELDRQEEQFNHAPPLAYLDYNRGAEDRSVVSSKLKTLKTVARLCTKQEWYRWRRELHLPLNQNLQTNLSAIKEHMASLTAMNKQLEDCIKLLQPIVLQMQSQTDLALERQAALKNSDWEQAAQLEIAVNKQNETLQSLDTDLNQLVQQEQELRAAIETTIKERQAYQLKSTALKEELEAIPECSASALEELRSLVAINQAALAWELAKIAPLQFTAKYLRAGSVTVLFELAMRMDGVGEGQNATVTRIVIDSSKASLPCLRMASKLIHLPPSSTPLSLGRVFNFVGRSLDRLWRIDKQISMTSMQCAVQIADYDFSPDKNPAVRNAIAMTVAFYHLASQAKFDISLKIDNERLVYSGFKLHYGPIKETMLLDAVHLSLQARSLPIRRMVIAVHDILESTS